jgi:hypothetical protein
LCPILGSKKLDVAAKPPLEIPSVTLENWIYARSRFLCLMSPASGILSKKGCVLPPSAAAAAPVSSTAASKPATATATGVSFFHGSRFVYSEISPAEFRAIELSDCLLCGTVVAHFNESKSLGTSGIPIRDDFDRINLPRL